MAKKTIQERLIEALKLQGCPEVQSRSTKYRVFMDIRTAKKGGFLYVGKAGALRFGKTVTDSRPADAYKAALLGTVEE